jgi:FAS-associated factor 2
MSSETPELDSLSTAQRELLQQYVSVTDQDTPSAVALLTRCQWNVQIAITRFFDGEPVSDPVAEAQAAIPQPEQNRRAEVLMNGFGHSNGSAHSSRSTSREGTNLEPAPRIVPQPETQVNRQMPLVFALLFTPINVLYNVFTRIFRLLPFLGRIFAAPTGAGHQSRNTSGRRPLSPRDTAARFIREFEEEYGSATKNLPLMETGYATAFDTAKRELKFLLVILLSPEHDDTAPFVRTTLLSSTVTTFLNSPANKDKLLVWAGTVVDPEAYQLSSAINATKFPFAALICHTPSVSTTSMSVIARIAGPVTPDAFTTTLRNAMNTHADALATVRETRNAQTAARRLREDQEQAYERSLAADRERTRREKEEREKAKKEEEEAKQKAEEAQRLEKKKEQWKHWRAAQIKPELTSGDVVRVSIRMGDGERVVRKFDGGLPLEEVYAFVECYDILKAEEAAQENAEKPQNFEFEYKFNLVSPMPREVVGLQKGGTIKERIGRAGNFVVEEIVEDEEDEEDFDEKSEQ